MTIQRVRLLSSKCTNIYSFMRVSIQRDRPSGLFNFSLKEAEVFDGLFDFDHQFLTHFHLNTKYPTSFRLHIKSVSSENYRLFHK